MSKNKDNGIVQSAELSQYHSPLTSMCFSGIAIVAAVADILMISYAMYLLFDLNRLLVVEWPSYWWYEVIVAILSIMIPVAVVIAAHENIVNWSRLKDSTIRVKWVLFCLFPTSIAMISSLVIYVTYVVFTGSAF